MNKFNAEHSIFTPIVTPLIYEQPVKTSGAELVKPELLQQQADLVIASLLPVDYKELYGTCIDERGRTGLRNGRPTQPRPSTPGGPNIYALGAAELIGLFDNQSQLSAEDRLHNVSGWLAKGKFKGGGHDDCRANAAFEAWMSIIAYQANSLRGYVKRELGERYSESAADFVVGNAGALVMSSRYNHWQESALSDELGDEAGEAIEFTYKVPHEAITFVRNKVKNTTIDQTRVYQNSNLGRGSFDVDDDYVNGIEHVLTSGPDAVIKKLQAEHAREFILAALIEALPNEELYQFNLTLQHE